MGELFGFKVEDQDIQTLEQWLGSLSPKAQQRVSDLVSVLMKYGSNGGSGSASAILHGFAKNIRDNPNTGGWIRRLLEQLADKPLEKLISNFIIGVAYESFKLREEYRKRTGVTAPMTIVINPTMACNLRCVGCYAWNYHKKHADYDMLVRLLEEVKGMGVRFITVSGGEPLLYPHLFKLLEEFDDMIFMMYTNGTLIDEETAYKIAEHGNLWPAISVEGYEEHTDNRRGKGTFKKVEQAMDNLKKAGVIFGFSATPVKSNSEVLASDEYIDYLIDHGCLFGWFFNYVPVGRSPDVSLMPEPKQRDMLRRKTREWLRTKPIFIGDFWNDGPAAGGCISASRYAYVTVEGNVQPCTFVHFYTHSLKEHTFDEIWRSPFFEAIRQRQPYNRNLLRPCKIIDNPEVLEEVVKEVGAKPSYPGADQIIKNPKIREFLKKYAEEYGKLADEAWKSPEYQEGHSVLVPFLGKVDLFEYYKERLSKFLEPMAGCHTSSTVRNGTSPANDV